jgi:hypothetical protein
MHGAGPLVSLGAAVVRCETGAGSKAVVNRLCLSGLRPVLAFPSTPYRPVKLARGGVYGLGEECFSGKVAFSSGQ